jgi:ribokinase
LPPRPWLTVVGSINLDFVTQCERLPRPGETVTGAEFAVVPGGKGANQALAAQRLGAYVDIIGCMGKDWMANEAIQYLTAEKVGLDVSVVDEPTGVAVILVDAEGENQIVVAPGANLLVIPEQIGFPEHAVLCQLEIPIETVAAAAERARGFFCLNAAPALPVPAEVLGRADLVVVNRHELDALAELPHLVALTLGPEGAVLLEDGEEVVRAAPPEVEAVDGTAAGDAFTACLVVSLLEDRDHEEALRRACAAGAIAASRPGAQPSLPTAAEVDEILRA